MSKALKFSLVLGLFFIGAAPAIAYTEIPGYITSDTQLTLAGSPYIAVISTTTGNDLLYVGSGVTLTIDPGVEVTGSMYISGNLVVAGATTSPAVLNGVIQLVDNSSTTINNAVINGNLYGFGAMLQTSNLLINTAPEGYYGLYWDTGDFIHSSTTITGGGLVTGFVVSLSQMTHDQVWTNDNNIPYIITAGELVQPGVHLTIEPGVIVKVLEVSDYEGRYIRNKGTISVQGSTSSPVYITSIKDDSVGGDTNGDGSATLPQAGDWKGFINNYLDASMSFNHAVFSYGSYVLSGNNFTGSNSRISSSSGAALSTPNSTFTNMELVGNSMGVNNCDHLAIHNSVIAGNTRGVVCGDFTGSTMTDNWWGDASGPYNATFNPSGLGNSVDGELLLYYPWIGASSTCSAGCSSNVMFLPGFEASYLYDNRTCGENCTFENQIWVPDGLPGLNPLTDQDISSLDLINPLTVDSVYVKEGDILKNPYSFYKLYDTFVSQMNDLTSPDVIREWKPIAYDWRLDYQRLLSAGNKVGEKIYYRGTNAATTTPYIIHELQRLAKSSRTGKVTIIAHSNGGLLAKALTNALGTTTASQLIDKIVMVATPQLGTPKTIGATLNGFDSGLPSLFSILFSERDARNLATSTPAVYNLLPSEQYFTYIDDPVITFNSTVPDWIAEYTETGNPGAGIHSVELMRNFMTDSGRTVPAFSDTATPAIASSTLFDNAQNVHESLDAWVPPPGVQLITIAGWGNETLSGIEYGKAISGCSVAGSNGCAVPTYGNQITYYPKVTIDGDGTVVEPSALWANGATGTKYWLNLDSYNRVFGFSLPDAIRKKHANILEVPELQELLAAIVTNSSTSTLPEYITTTQPDSDSVEPRLHFVLHSPLTLGFTDTNGNYTGSTATSTVFNVLDIDYERFGEVQWLSVPASMAGQVRMQGTGSGTFSLDIESVNGNDVLATTTFVAVPVATTTIATLDISPSVSPTASSTLLVDSDGNGSSDIILHSQENSLVLPPKITIGATTSMAVNVAYENLPADSVLVFVKSNGVVADGYRTPIPAGGSGSTTLITMRMPTGTYTLQVQSLTSTTSVAQSTAFSRLLGPYILIGTSYNASAHTVTANYAWLPLNSELVFVNATSSQVVAGYGAYLAAGGTGSVVISTAGMTPGTYYLRARDNITKSPEYSRSPNISI